MAEIDAVLTEAQLRAVFPKSPQMFQKTQDPTDPAAAIHGPTAPQPVRVPAPAPLQIHDPVLRARQVQVWEEELRADPEYGTPEAIHIARGVIQTHGDQALKDVLNVTGLG